MMKWLGRILFAVVAFFIGVFVIRVAQINSQLKYYNEYAPKLMEEDNVKEYMATYLTANMIDKYLIDPIYVAKSLEDEDFKFNFTIYHVMIQYQNEVQYYLVFYFNDLGINYDKVLEDPEVFEKNKNSAAVRIELTMGDKEEKSTEVYKLDFNTRMPNILVQVTENEQKEKLFRTQFTNKDGKGESRLDDQITAIDFSLIDSTKAAKTEDIKETKFAQIIHDKDAVMEYKADQKVYDTFTKEEDILVSKAFNGKIDNYVKEAEYQNDDLLGPIYLDQLVPFKKGVNKALGIYIAVVALITYLAYFLKPTLAFFEGKREDKKKTVAQARKIAEKEEKLLVENEVLEVEEFQEEIEEESKKLEVTTEEELVIEEEPKVIQEDLNSNTVAELKKMAKDLGITGYSTLRKQELIDIINKHK